MRKSLLLAAAGAAVVFAGCQDPVMQERRYKPAPGDEPETMVSQTPAPAPVAAVPQQTPKFEPMTGAVSTGGVDSVAGAKTGKVSGNTYTVAPGDNPARIAKKLHVKVSALMEANNLTPEAAKKLKVGQKLVIPAGGKAVKSSAAVKSAKTAAVKSASVAAEAAPADGKYVVKAGDSPEKIARKFGVKLSDLLKANNLTAASARRLQIGQKLVIPGAEVPAAPATAAASADSVALPAEPAAVAPAAETVTAAETTAAETTAGETAAPAAAASSQGTGDLVPVFPEADESVESFARSHNVTPDEIRKLNSGIVDKVTRDMVVYLPSR